MTREEYAAWLAETEKSRTQWMLDEIQYLNHGRFLFYRGGTDGHYFTVDPDGTLSMGRYEGALPHIGEAGFFQRAARQFPGREAALTHLLERGGVPMLMALVGANR